MTEQAWIDHMITEIADKKNKQADIADYYLDGLCNIPIDGWKPVNEAVVARWSKSGLERVKKMAWKLRQATQ